MATGSPATLNAAYEYREIDIDLIDEPATPERETMDPEGLGELALSIQAEGLIKPLIVKPAGKRFEVIAGHRRLLSCRMVSYTPVPCRVRLDDAASTLSTLVHENAFTEPVNPVEEARFYRRVLEAECGNDVDVLCIKVRRRRDFVEDRLLLLIGHPRVEQALFDRKISIAVARELNKTKDPNRLLILLDQSVTMGATARQVMEWRKHYNQQDPIELPPDGTPASGDFLPAPVAISGPCCFFCQDTFEPASMEIVYLHRLCRRQVDRLLGRDPAQPAGSEFELPPDTSGPRPS